MCTSLRFQKIGCGISTLLLQMITRASWYRSMKVHVLFFQTWADLVNMIQMHGRNSSSDYFVAIEGPYKIASQSIGKSKIPKPITCITLL